MDKKINILIKKYSDSELLLNKLVVSSFLIYNNLKIDDGFLFSYLADKKDGLDEDIALLSKECTIEDVINIFELAIPESEKIINGAIYTPSYIRNYIVNMALHSIDKTMDECLCADIACGCGAFLYTLAEYIHFHTKRPFINIYHNLYGVDISRGSINRTKILLALVALKNGEYVSDKDFNLYCANSLTFDLKSIPKIANNLGVDIIVGNPPYVRSRNIDASIKQSLSLWPTSSSGNADLYIPFFEVGMSLLNETGILGYITVNTFFKSVNARALRCFLSEKHFSFKIIDFGEQLVFKKKLAYTCMVFLSKSLSNSLFYTKANILSIESGRELDYNRINYDKLDNISGWHLNRNEILENIHLIESTGEALGDKYIIKNGIATLANEIYIFRPASIDDHFYYLIREEKEYPIEKEICRDIIKPNKLKTEEEISEKIEKVIYPYDMNFKPISEDCFICKYPFAYKYLMSCKNILDARDKGKGKYEAWYAYGRTQAIADHGRKLLFPYMSDFPHFVYTSQRDMMIYCGYAIYNESETELLLLKKLLESCVFEYYIKNTSKPYSTGYYSFAKNYVKSFGVYPFNEEQKKHLLSLKNKDEVDEYLKTIYRINI